MPVGYNEAHGRGYTRQTVNKYICYIKQCFDYGALRDYFDESIADFLRRVPQLKKGRTTAPDQRRGKPVDLSVMLSVLPHLSPVVADMVRIQYLCGMRPGEVCNMRWCDIDEGVVVSSSSPGTWRYIPFTHKTENRNCLLQKPINKEAQEILEQDYIAVKRAAPESFLFSPADTMRIRNEKLRKNRKTLNKRGEVQPSHKNRKKKNPKRAPGLQYTVCSYRNAIRSVCIRVGLPVFTPHQVRHSSATVVRRVHGLDGAQALLGHSDAKTTEIYAELDFERAVSASKVLTLRTIPADSPAPAG